MKKTFGDYPPKKGVLLTQKGKTWGAEEKVVGAIEGISRGVTTLAAASYSLLDN